MILAIERGKWSKIGQWIVTKPADIGEGVSKIQKKYCHRLWMVPMVKKLCKSKNLSNHRVFMLKNPLQVTCDAQRVFQHDHSVI
jgi:hypothetical protein